MDYLIKKNLSQNAQNLLIWLQTAHDKYGTGKSLLLWRHTGRPPTSHVESCNWFLTTSATKYMYRILYNKIFPCVKSFLGNRPNANMAAYLTFVFNKIFARMSFRGKSPNGDPLVLELAEKRTNTKLKPQGHYNILYLV